MIGLDARTVQRWRRPGHQAGDLRAAGKRRITVPSNKFSHAERQAALALMNSDQFKDLPPSQIVPRLADQGLYVASESTLYRLLREVGQLAHRRLERVAQKRSKPRALVATGPDQVYCWDISYLPTEVRGVYFYLYLFVDLFSRQIVGWQVYDCESAALASELLKALLAMAAFAVVYAAVTFVVKDSYYQLMLTLVLVWATFGLSWNLLSG